LFFGFGKIEENCLPDCFRSGKPRLPAEGIDAMDDPRLEPEMNAFAAGFRPKGFTAGTARVFDFVTHN